KPVQGYLAVVGLRPTAEDISARMTGNLTASISPNPNDGIKVNLKLDNARLTADGAEAAALDQLTANIDTITAGSAKITKLDLSGVRANASRNSTGALALAGVEVVPPAPATQPTVIVTATAPPAAAPTSPFQVSLGSFSLSGLHLAFMDQFVSPPV